MDTLTKALALGVVLIGVASAAFAEAQHQDHGTASTSGSMDLQAMQQMMKA